MRGGRRRGQGATRPERKAHRESRRPAPDAGHGRDPTCPARARFALPGRGWRERAARRRRSLRALAGAPTYAVALDAASPPPQGRAAAVFPPRKRQAKPRIPKRSDEALRRAEERYRLLVQASSAVVWHADPAGETFEPSPSWEAYTGQRYPGGLGLSWLDEIDPDDRERMIGVWVEARADPRVIKVEVRVWSASSRRYRHCLACGVPLLDDEGRVREWVGTLTDVDDCRRAEQAAHFLADATTLLAGLARPGADARRAGAARRAHARRRLHGAPPGGRRRPHGRRRSPRPGDGGSAPGTGPARPEHRVRRGPGGPDGAHREPRPLLRRVLRGGRVLRGALRCRGVLVRLRAPVRAGPHAGGDMLRPRRRQRPAPRGGGHRALRGARPARRDGHRQRQPLPRGPARGGGAGGVPGHRLARAAHAAHPAQARRAVAPEAGARRRGRAGVRAAAHDGGAVHGAARRARRGAPRHRAPVGRAARPRAGAGRPRRGRRRRAAAIPAGCSPARAARCASTPPARRRAGGTGAG